MIGVLAAKKLVVRQGSATDRRQLSLALTSRGAQVFKGARDQARRHLAKQLVALGIDEHERICSGVTLLGEIFGTDARPDATGGSPKCSGATHTARNRAQRQNAFGRVI